MEDFLYFAGLVITILWCFKVKLFRYKEKRLKDILYFIGMMVLIFGAIVSLYLFFETYGKYSRGSHYLRQNPDSIIAYFDFIQWRYAKVMFIAGFIGSILAGTFFLALTKIMDLLEGINRSLKENAGRNS